MNKITIRYKLLIWFLLFSFILILLFIPLNLIRNSKEKSINDLNNNIHQLQLSLVNDLKTTSEFFTYEATNPLFYITGESRYLDDHEKFNAKSDSLLHQVIGAGKLNDYNVSTLGNQLSKYLEQYKITFDSIVTLTYFKGYNNFGLEGEMFEYISSLEEVYKIDPGVILKLRTNEKNYLLRRRNIYAKNLNTVCNSLIRKYTEENSADAEKIIDLLTSYKKSFNRVVEFDNKIGVNSTSGLKQDLFNYSGLIEKKIGELQVISSDNYKASLRFINLSYFAFIGVILVLVVLLSLVFSKKLSAPLRALTCYIQELAKSNFHYPANSELRKSTKEIRLIYDEFRELITQLYIRENQRDKARMRSQENEKKYRELAEMLPQSIFETDYLGNYTFVNKEWFYSFGYEPKDIQHGLNLIETLISERGDRIMSEGNLKNSEFVAIRKDKSTFPATVYTTNIIKGNKIIGKRGIIIDVTERNKYIAILKHEKDKAQVADKLKSSFLANMSHEIRTPMNSIIGFSELLDVAELTDNQKKDFLNHIKSSGEMLLNLIDDIIDIAKIEAGEIKINKRECNINEVLGELNTLFTGYKKQVNKEHINLIINCPSEELIIKSDPFRLKQVLYNLVSNAIKFTDKGKVEFGYEIKNDKNIEFYVNDTGIGLTKDKLRFIFKRFKQIEEANKKGATGHGLGLAISKNLVELLGGEMWVDSEPGAGTRFSFTHPLNVIQKAEKKIVKIKKESDSNYSWYDKKILVVEDDNISFSFLKEAIVTKGAQIIRAYDGKEAVEMATQMDIDIVLMDIQIPVFDGYEATKRIKDIKPTLPIIAQTARAMANEKEQSIMAGCDDYIAKPIRINILLPKIAQFIETGTKSKTTTGNFELKESDFKNPSVN